MDLVVLKLRSGASFFEDLGKLLRASKLIERMADCCEVNELEE